jgi:hypothetical protein
MRGDLCMETGLLWPSSQRDNGSALCVWGVLSGVLSLAGSEKNKGPTR